MVASDSTPAGQTSERDNERVAIMPGHAPQVLVVAALAGCRSRLARLTIVSA